MDWEQPPSQMRRAFEIREHMDEKVVWIGPAGVIIFSFDSVALIARLLVLLRSWCFARLRLAIIEDDNLIGAKDSCGAGYLAGQ